MGVAAPRSVRWVEDRDSGLVHVDVPGTITATFARHEGSARCLFARTPIPAKLGVPGGRAELIAALLIQA